MSLRTLPVIIDTGNMPPRQKVEFVITKIPGKPRKVIKPSFPPLSDLCLELVENKKKLKPDLPLIPMKPIKAIPRKPEPEPEEDDEEEEVSDDGEDDGEEDGDDLEDLEEDEEGEEGDEEEDQGNKKEEKEEPIDPAKELDEYLWRFRILKKAYPHRSIPEFNHLSDLTIMKDTYHRMVREIRLDKKLSTWQKILIYGAKGTEYISTNMLGIDIEGFATSELAEIDKYNELLIELGDRPYTNIGGSLPVEMKLIFMMMTQAGIFYMMKNGGGTMFNKDKDDSKDAGMKGPSITPDDIARMKVD